jgi:hypothetical protein
MRKQIALACFALSLVLFGSSPTQAIESPPLNSQDTDPSVRTPITHGFWFPKTVTIGEEWYRGRLIAQGGHAETGELPDSTDGHSAPDGHLGFTAINNTRWNITHHWFGGDDENAEKQLYSRNPVWFFDPVKPANSVMGVFALFRWGILNEIEARLAIHDMIKSYTDRECSILADGVWLGAMANLSVTKFQVNDGPRTVPNPLGVPVDQAIRNEISVIITHHFFGRNKDNTVMVMNQIYDDLVKVLEDFNAGMLSEKKARRDVTDLVNQKIKK